MSCLIFTADNKLVVSESNLPFYGGSVHADHFNVKSSTTFISEANQTWNSGSTTNVELMLECLVPVSDPSSPYYISDSVYPIGVLHEYVVIDSNGNIVSAMMYKNHVPTAEDVSAWNSATFRYKKIADDGSGTSGDFTDFTQYRGYVELYGFSDGSTTAASCKMFYSDSDNNILIRDQGAHILGATLGEMREFAANTKSYSSGENGTFTFLRRIYYTHAYSNNTEYGLGFFVDTISFSSGRYSSYSACSLRPDVSSATGKGFTQYCPSDNDPYLSWSQYFKIPSVVNKPDSSRDELKGLTKQATWLSNLAYSTTTHNITATAYTVQFTNGLATSVTSTSKTLHSAFVDQVSQPKNRPSGSLVYKKSGGQLCYSRSTGYPIVTRYQEDPSTSNPYITITVTWNSPCDDLDICGYWKYTSIPGENTYVGGSYNQATTQQLGPANRLSTMSAKWGGDNTSVGGSEWVRIRIDNAVTSDNFTYVVHLNFYGEPAEGTTCSRVVHVTCTYPNSRGGTNSLQPFDITAAGRSYEAATTSDPSFSLRCRKYTTNTGRVYYTVTRV